MHSHRFEWILSIYAIEYGIKKRLPKNENKPMNTHASDVFFYIYLDYVTLNCKSHTRDLIVYLFFPLNLFAYTLSFQGFVFIHT